MAGCMRFLQLAATKSSYLLNIPRSSTKSSYLLNIPRSFVNRGSPSSTTSTRQFSGVKSNCFFSLVDSLQLVRRLEAQGVPLKLAEAIATALAEDDSLDNVAHYLISEAEMPKMLRESDLSEFKYKMQSSEEYHSSMVQRETKKILNELDKMISELSRHEIEKITAAYQEVLDTKKGCILDGLANQKAKTTNLKITFNREIQALRAEVEALGDGVLKFCISITSLAAVAFLYGLASRELKAVEEPEVVEVEDKELTDDVTATEEMSMLILLESLM